MIRPILSLALIFFLGCSSSLNSIYPVPRESPRWFQAKTTKPRGAFLVVHGLNLRASALDPLCDVLATNGFHVYRMTLAGHNEPIQEVFDETLWLQEVQEAYKLVRGTFNDLPVYGFGYSLGGLLLTNIVDTLQTEEHPRALILLAPALSLHTAFDISSALRLPPRLASAFPNFAPSSYRRAPYTPLFWYSNILAANRRTQTLTNPNRVRTIPTLVILNPHDELISETGTQEWIDKNKLAPKWRIQLVEPRPTDPSMKQHLMIDDTSLGRMEWRRLQEMVIDFIANA